MKRSFFVCFFSLCQLVGLAQTDTIFNTKGVERIPYYEQLYRFRVWRAINLKEKQNAVYVPKGGTEGLIQFIYANLKSGNLTTYSPGDVNFEKEETFLDKFKIGTAAEGASYDPTIAKYGEGEKVLSDGKIYVAKATMLNVVAPPEDPWVIDRRVKKPAASTPQFDARKSYKVDDKVAFGGKQYVLDKDIAPIPPVSDVRFWTESGDAQDVVQPGKITSMTLVEDVIFNKKTGRLTYDIQGFVLYAEETDTTGVGGGQLIPRCIVNYKQFHDLVEKTYKDRSMSVRKAVTFSNRYNPAKNMSFAEAFKLRLFHGIIDKVENPDDLTITDIFTNNGRSYGESVFARWEEEMKMMEKEHNLWEY